MTLSANIPWNAKSGHFQGDRLVSISPSFWSFLNLNMIQRSDSGAHHGPYATPQNAAFSFKGQRKRGRHGVNVVWAVSGACRVTGKIRFRAIVFVRLSIAHHYRGLF